METVTLGDKDPERGEDRNTFDVIHSGGELEGSVPWLRGHTVLDTVGPQFDS